MVRMVPVDPRGHRELAWILATCPVAAIRDGKRAMAEATVACELTRWKDPDCVDTLAAACAEAKDFDGAVKWETQAIEMWRKQNDPTANLRKESDMRDRLSLYTQATTLSPGPRQGSSLTGPRASEILVPPLDSRTAADSDLLPDSDRITMETPGDVRVRLDDESLPPKSSTHLDGALQATAPLISGALHDEAVHRTLSSRPTRARAHFSDRAREPGPDRADGTRSHPAGVGGGDRVLARAGDRGRPQGVRCPAPRGRVAVS